MIKYFTENLKIKIVVVCIAILIWFFVETENNYRYAVDIPIKISNLSSDKIITNDYPEQVKVTMWGKGRELLALILNQKLHYNLDLTNESKSKIFKLNKKNVRFTRASNIEILNILEPDTIEIRFENLLRKKVPIVPRFEVNTLSGYTVVRGIKLSQDSVIIEGSKTALDSITEIKTERHVYKRMRRDLHETVDLIKPDVKYAWAATEKVDVFVDVQKLLEKPLTEIPVKVLNKPVNVDLTVIPSSLSLTAIGGVDILLPMTSKDINAYIDYNKVRLSKEKYYLAYIEKPDEVRIKDIRPKHFKIIVRKKH